MPKQNAGLSLLEMMLTLALGAVLLLIAASPMSYVLDKHLADRTLLAIARAIQAARSAAIQTNMPVTICRTSNSLECGGAWREGLIVFTDRNRDRQLNQDDRLLQQLQFNNLPGDISWSAFQHRQYLQINSRGNLQHQNGSFRYCPFSGDGRHARQLVISSTGRARFSNQVDAAGLRLDGDGKPIRCAN